MNDYDKIECLLKEIEEKIDNMENIIKRTIKCIELNSMRLDKIMSNTSRNSGYRTPIHSPSSHRFCLA
jgi:RNA-binding protein YlmH